MGSHAGNVLPPLLRWVLTLGMYCLPSCDWFSMMDFHAVSAVAAALAPALCKVARAAIPAALAVRMRGITRES
eukprot:7615062-Pyramimonas_sp.AAC.1